MTDDLTAQALGQPQIDSEKSSKRFEVHMRSHAVPFKIDCHGFREHGDYLQFDDERGNAVAMFPTADLVAMVRIEGPGLAVAGR